MAGSKEYTALKKAIANKKLKGCYVLHGAEAYLREYYLGEMRKLVVADGFADFNYKKLDGKLGLDSLQEAVESLPSFSERSFVEVRDLDIYKCADDAAQKLGIIIKELPEYCHLVFVYDALEFKADKRRKIHKIISEYAETVEFLAQDISDLINWVRRRFAQSGKDISRENAEYLIHYSGNLMRGLISEIDKISAYCEAKTVEREDIELVAVPVVEAVVFNMTNAISKNDYDRAADIMSRLFTMRESPIMMLALIGSELRKTYAAKLVRDSGQGASYLKSLLSLRSDYQAGNLMEAAHGVSRVWCEKALCLCAETDLMMKSSSADENELLVTLLLNLAGERRL